jgi:outer membrane protein OmpA-like peptidoglycan-associated protein
MTSRRWLALALGPLVAGLGCACGARHVAAPTEPGHALIVLLPDPESGTTGQATIWNRSGSVDLAGERDAVALASDRRPGPVTRISADDVERLFGRALDALPPEPRSFTLHFKFESDELTDESARLLPSVLADVKQRSDPEVAVIGHTDTMGLAKANIELGMKRAAFVRHLLIDAGLDPATIDLVSHGEAALLIRTPDETPEPRNRRVEITVR